MGKLSDTEILQCLDAWGKKSSWHHNNLAERFQVAKAVTRPVFAYRLRTQYEERWSTREQVPYQLGDDIDDEGTPPAIWRMSLREPKGFENVVLKKVIPHTDAVESCACYDGKVDCTNCNGSGRVSCTRCFGFGTTTEWRTETEQFTDHDGHWQTRSNSVTYQETCVWCGGFGSINCKDCEGSGTETCAECDGTARVLTFDQVNCRYFCKDHCGVVNPTTLPDEHLSTSQSISILKQTAPKIAEIKFSESEASAVAINLAIRMSHAEKGNLWYQEVDIRKIPVIEVTVARIKDGAAVNFWIYGLEKSVFAPGFPTAKSRISLAVAVFVAVVTGIIYLMTLLAPTNPAPPVEVAPATTRRIADDKHSHEEHSQKLNQQVKKEKLNQEVPMHKGDSAPSAAEQEKPPSSLTDDAKDAVQSQ